VQAAMQTSIQTSCALIFDLQARGPIGPSLSPNRHVLPLRSAFELGRRCPANELEQLRGKANIKASILAFSQANKHCRSNFTSPFCINIAQRLLSLRLAPFNPTSLSIFDTPNNNNKPLNMEALLSLSFDNLSSYDQSKIRKGLRQVEGLLAQICLSSSSPKAATEKRRSVIDPGKEPPPRKPLQELASDPAFREFFKLQEGFEWNVALRLVNCLDRLLGKMNDGQNDLLIIQTLDLIQGILLLHPPSRSLFSREIYMNVCIPSHTLYL
jgi:hypothetical protein